MASKKCEVVEEFRPLRKYVKRKSFGEEEQVQPYGKEFHIRYEGRNQPKLGESQEQIEKIRFENGIEVDENDCPTPITNFENSDLQSEIIEVLGRRNIIAPTPVQMQAVPILTSGRDLIAIAPTGSGKTLGYLLPMCAFLKANIAANSGQSIPLAIIVVPTRELMQQTVDTCQDFFNDLNQPTLHPEGLSAKNYVHSESQGTGYYRTEKGQNPYWNMPPINNTQAMHNFAIPYQNFGAPFHVSQQLNCAYGTNFKTDAQIIPNMENKEIRTSFSVCGICGGVSMKSQIERLRGDVDVIVATPGRLIDLCQRNLINLENIKYIVLDECDKMLEMGLEEQLRKLMALITSKDIPRQTSLWSATLPASLERLARSAVINPITLHIGLKDTVCKNIEQNVIFMHTYLKEKKLLQTLRQTKYPPVIVFISSIAGVGEVTKLLKDEEFFVKGLHSHLEQDERFRVLSEFRDGTFDILVATDLASRGLDIPDVTHVINFDTPNTIEDYIHRCGRTGRLGRPGKATTFLTLECKIAEDLKLLLETTGVPLPIALEDTKQFGKKVLKTELGDRVL